MNRSEYTPGGQSALHSLEDSRFSSQGYLHPAPLGIDAIYAWSVPGGDGAGVGIVDIERGWTLDHVALEAAGVRIISGVNQDHFGHGTAVLGMLVAGDDVSPCKGIVPKATVRVVSQFQPDGFDAAKAILSAVAAMQPGEILLLEMQTTACDVDRLPIEAEPACFDAIRAAVGRGIVVVEAGGNGSLDLDLYCDSDRGYVFNRSSPDFRDSGAIVVGAANAPCPHVRHRDSNYGSRFDCYGWGERVVTTGDGKNGNLINSYTDNFGGTSAASPMISGAAAVIQGVCRMKFGAGLEVERMRMLLRDPALGTVSADPASDRIGVMPDLRRLILSLTGDTSLANPQAHGGVGLAV